MRKKILFLFLTVLLISFIGFLYQFIEPVPNFSNRGFVTPISDKKILGYYVKDEENLLILALDTSSLGVYLYNRTEDLTKPLSEGVVLGIDDTKLGDKFAKNYADNQGGVYFEIDSYLIFIDQENNVNYFSYIPESVFDDRVVNKTAEATKIKKDILEKYQNSDVPSLKISKINDDIQLFIHLFSLDSEFYYSKSMSQNILFFDKDGEVLTLKGELRKSAGVYYYDIAGKLILDKTYVVNANPRVSISYKCYEKFNLSKKGLQCRSNRLILRAGLIKKYVLPAENANIYLPYNKKMILKDSFVYLDQNHSLKLYSL